MERACLPRHAWVSLGFGLETENDTLPQIHEVGMVLITTPFARWEWGGEQHPELAGCPKDQGPS